MHDQTNTERDPHDAGRQRVAEWSLGILGSLTALLAPLAVLGAPRSDVVAVVGAPGDDAADLIRVVARADGTILSAGGSDNIILARSTREGFVTRLYAAGARLVLDADSAEACVRKAARATSLTNRATPR